MATKSENPEAGTQRTRRNIMRMGAIAVPATLGMVRSAAAQPIICQIPILNLFVPQCDPPTPVGGHPPSGGGGNCFLKGTRILTAEGECKIEDLAIGDLLPTMFGGLRPIHWIGRYPIKKSDPSKPWVKGVRPIRIAQGALGANMPHADLYVTAFHSFLIEGVLVPAEALINGATITRHDPSETNELEYFHVKLESHDVIYAEGAPAETLLEVTEAAVNFADYLRQYGTPATAEGRCAPYVHAFGGRDELKSRLRSAVSPWIDLRDRADMVRDRLEEHGLVSVV